MNAVVSASTIFVATKTSHCPVKPDLVGGLVEFPEGSVDLETGQVSYADGESAELSGRELALLQYLSKNAGRIISREELLVQVWLMNSNCIITRTIDMHVAKLRDKLRDDAQHPKMLLTIRGEGYVFLSTPRPTAQMSVLAQNTEGALPALALCG